MPETPSNSSAFRQRLANKLFDQPVVLHILSKLTAMRHSEHRSSGRDCRFHAPRGTRGLHRRPLAQRCPRASGHLSPNKRSQRHLLWTKWTGVASYEHFTGSKFHLVPAASNTLTFLYISNPHSHTAKASGHSASTNSC